MKIAVCVKQVVTREWPLRVDDARTWVQDRDASFEMNEPDAYALEEALRLAKENGTYFITITRTVGDTLKHCQFHTSSFSKDDLQPSLAAVEELVTEAYPELLQAQE